jgi:cytochrome c oxidase assembly protein subunit 15
MVWALMKAIINAQSSWEGNSKSLSKVALTMMLLAVVQILFGTQVREGVDVIKTNQDHVADWLEALTDQSHWLEIHRLMAFVVTFGTFYLLWKVNSIKADKLITFAAQLASISVVLAMLSGIILAYYNLPAFAQPIHLTLGTLIAGCHIWIYLSSSVPDSNKAAVLAV